MKIIICCVYSPGGCQGNKVSFALYAFCMVAQCAGHRCHFGLRCSRLLGFASWRWAAGRQGGHGLQLQSTELPAAAASRVSCSLSSHALCPLCPSSWGGWRHSQGEPDPWARAGLWPVPGRCFSQRVLGALAARFPSGKWVPHGFGKGNFILSE